VARRDLISLFGDILRSRLLTGVCGLFLLAACVFSSLFVIAEADHDCAGPSCAVCLQIQACAENAPQLDAPPPSAAVVHTAPVSPSDSLHAPDYRAPATTLRSLDVRWNE